MLPTALIALFTSCLAASGIQCALVDDKYSCPHGWTRYGSKKCLKYINDLQDYERAQSTCKSKNAGTLVSIHSHEEQNFVYSYIHSIAASQTPVWLGAKQLDFESILWLDKTENSYTNWAPSEPSHPDEICIAINPRNGMWHDVMCTEANVPACERAPTTQWPFFVPFCSEGWFQFNDEKCVRIISSQALNFYESQELCRSKYNSKLLSVKTDKESEFLHNLIKFRDVKLPVWLGAVQNDFSSFNWIDKSDVTFTNWAESEPNDPDHACLSMTASGGKWADNDCKEQKLILCQKAVPEESSCETGWLQFRQDKCYRFVHIRLAFDDAESLCNNLYGGHLPSIHSQEEQFMISQFLASVNVKNGSEIWLGGRQMDFHNFNWGDGSLFNYSYWEQGEPNFPAEKCIEMSWRNGRWNDINCRVKRQVLCERPVTSGRQLFKPSTLHYNCLETVNCSAPSAIGSVMGITRDQTLLDQADPSMQLHPTPLITLPTYNISSTIPDSELEKTGVPSGLPPANLTDRNSAESNPMQQAEDKSVKVIISSSVQREQPGAKEQTVPLVSSASLSPGGSTGSTTSASDNATAVTVTNNLGSGSTSATTAAPNNETSTSVSNISSTPSRVVVEQQQVYSESSQPPQIRKEPLIATENKAPVSEARPQQQTVAQQSFDTSNSSLLDKLKPDAVLASVNVTAQSVPASSVQSSSLETTTPSPTVVNSTTPKQQQTQLHLSKDFWNSVPAPESQPKLV